MRQRLESLEAKMSSVVANLTALGSGAASGPTGPAGHRYWRVRFDATSYYSSQWTMVVEIEYFVSVNGVRTQIAPASLAALSSAGNIHCCGSSWGEAGAYDGTTVGNHATGAGTSSEDGTFAMGRDFGASDPKWVEQVIVYGPNNFGFHYDWATDIYLEYSDDQTTWTQAAAQMSVAGTSSVITLVSIVTSA